MSTIIYRTATTIGERVGNDFLVTQQDMDAPSDYTEVYALSNKSHEWVAGKTFADIENGNYERIKNNSFRGLLSNMALHTPVHKQPKIYFIEKEVQDV